MGSYLNIYVLGGSKRMETMVTVAPGVGRARHHSARQHHALSNACVNTGLWQTEVRPAIITITVRNICPVGNKYKLQHKSSRSDDFCGLHAAINPRSVIGSFHNEGIQTAPNQGQNINAVLHGAHFYTSGEAIAARQAGQVGPPNPVLVRVERCGGAKNSKHLLNVHPDTCY